MFFVAADALAPGALEAQATQQISTSISFDASGVPFATITGSRVPAYHPSHVLVRLRNGAPQDFLPGSGPARNFPANPSLFLVENPPGLSVAEAVRNYRSRPSVLYAEPDFVVRTSAIPTDPLWSQQWDMAQISCPAAWDTQTDSSDVIVGVIDTGIDFTHPDLQGNLWTNPSDGSHGFTCINGACAAGGLDDFGHGTHVAGTIGGAANNGIGIAGINWKVQLLSLKFLDSTGSGLISDAVLCFQKVTALRQAGVNIRLTSNSWGGGGFSQTLKDAMSQAEAAGVVHVCAAGNSGQNADSFPMYPGAYDNRGIVSVLASDQNDAGASFSNYGLASVDIAAPGVSTLSTVPSGTCQLCDPSGYKFLSGTSMATPHVSGVLAALLHENPALTADQARDVVLDPASYDALTDVKAQSTSTGGRLNFAKVLANPLLFAPKLNNFPSLTIGPDAMASAGSQVNLTATASDPDNDPLRMGWSKALSPSSVWLFGYMLDAIFPSPTGSSVSFTAPPLARTAMVPYDASVADGRGGGVQARNYVTVSPASSPGLPPSGTLTVSPTNGPAGTLVTVNFPVTTSTRGAAMWDLWVSYNHGAGGSCCYTGSSTTVALSNPGAYRFTAQAVDSALNFSAPQTVVVNIGGVAGSPPIIGATQDKLSGPVPLTVNLDLSASQDPDGTVQYYFFDCGGGTFKAGSSNSKGSCTFSVPGSYWMLLEVQDNSGLMGVASAYAVATAGTAATPPTVSITSPTAGSTVSGTVSLTASASDSSGISQVAFYRDSGVLLGTATASPYAVSWNSSTVSAGAHTLYAVATDAAGNTGTSPSAGITVSIPSPPQVSITSPTNGTTVPRRSKLTIQASATPGTNAISRVDFVVNSTVVCSDTTGPYTCNWTVPSKAGATYQIHANAYDTAGVLGVSSNVTVVAK